MDNTRSDPETSELSYTAKAELDLDAAVCRLGATVSRAYEVLERVLVGGTSCGSTPEEERPTSGVRLADSLRCQVDTIQGYTSALLDILDRVHL